MAYAIRSKNSRNKAVSQPTGSMGQLQVAAQGLMPGGTYDKGVMSEIDLEGRRLAASLESQAIGRGLGNVTTGIPTVVGRQVASQKGAARRDMLGSYLNTLQYLTGAEQQEKQFGISTALQGQQMGLQREQISAGLSASNRQNELEMERLRLQGTLGGEELAAKTKTEQDKLALQKYIAELNSRTSIEKAKIGAESYPSLYSAGGYGSDFTTTVPSLF